MRWFKPECGDERIITKFAWLPIRIANEVRWLETVHIRQVHAVRYWHDHEFVDKE